MKAEQPGFDHRKAFGSAHDAYRELLRSGLPYTSALALAQYELVTLLDDDTCLAMTTSRTWQAIQRVRAALSIARHTDLTQATPRPGLAGSGMDTPEWLALAARQLVDARDALAAGERGGAKTHAAAALASLFSAKPTLRQV